MAAQKIQPRRGPNRFRKRVTMKKAPALKGGEVQTDTKIVEGLSAHIVLVDSKGIIHFVSEPWKGSGPDQVIMGKAFGVGANYIRACERIRGARADQAKVVAKGLRAVLAGKRDSFALEYSCHTGTKKQWFLVKITPVSRDKKAGAGIIQMKVTQRRQAEEDRKESERKLSMLMQSLPGMVYRCRNDRDWTLEFASEGAVALTGYESMELLGGKVSYGRQVIHPDDRHRVWKEVQSALRKKEPFQITYRIHTAEGKLKWVWEQGQAIYSPKGKVTALEGFVTDITTQKENEKAIKASEERLDLALLGGRLGMWDWNVQTGEVHMNERWTRMLGYAKDEIEPTIQAWKKLVHPDDKTLVLKLLQAHLQGHIPFYQTEHRLRTKSGKWKWILDTGKVVVRDSTGNPLRATGIHQDINERKEMEQAFLHEREFIDAVLETAGALVVVVDRKGRVVRFNRACEELTGLPAQEVIGQSFWKLDLIPSRELTAVKKVFEILCAGQPISHFENHWVGRDRTEHLLTWANTVLKNKKGQVEYVIGTSIDITERKHMEMALRQSQEQFQAFMDHAPTVAFLKDQDGRYVYVNQPFQQKFGRCQAECLGKTDRQLFPPEVAQMFKETDHETLTYGTVHESEEATLDERGKPRHWMVLKFPIHGMNEEKFIGGIALDITSRKEAQRAVQERELELYRYQEELRALGKRLNTAQEEERRRISRELHDDMNQRLAVLALNIQSSQKKFSESDPFYATLQQQYEDVSRISDDIRRLAYQLHPSVLDDLGLKVALQSFVQDFVQWAHILANFRAQNVPDGIPPDIAACLYRLTQESLRNVARHAAASKVTVELKGQNGGLHLSIVDNGKGFDHETIRANKRGLGLIGMQERVSYVNGTLTIQAVPGNGTEILVWVPLEKGDK